MGAVSTSKQNICKDGAFCKRRLGWIRINLRRRRGEAGVHDGVHLSDTGGG